MDTESHAQTHTQIDEPTELCNHRRMAARAGRERKAECRYFVTFKKPPIAWVEVTVVARSKKQAAAHAREIVKPLRGLVYQGVD